ncbi:MAG: transcription antitermination factor NusB [Candidatus Eisenbacteria bacterium]|uniref:Transcription antitermination protein NusB n=1 Tax=Eiseniibacteriota bacterium TaxID=2212470 RepID=A0A948RZT9_UNCEI|nr:transcription antitermination factor NusB [Candidatus Eisenbacteria bacterium]MBU1950393.1 transcription antitermination factor NusB [Candidatus Eisenbacteria bacterium]MBU2692986.1 transcription antitermination factor NusB [Candidatus Eisenbacteria bacterium]
MKLNDLQRRGGRRKARELVFRALYESGVTRDSLLEIMELSLGKFRLTMEGREYALQLTAACEQGLEPIDQVISSVLKSWDAERLGLVERAILRLAGVELKWQTAIDARIILDEAVRLATRYGSDESPAFVNGVLDPIARHFRPGELEGDAGGA